MKENNNEKKEGWACGIFSDELKSLLESVPSVQGYYPAYTQAVNDEVFEKPLIVFSAPNGKEKKKVEVWRNRPYLKNRAAREEYRGYSVKYEFEKDLNVDSNTCKNFQEKNDSILDLADAYSFAKSIAWKY